MVSHTAVHVHKHTLNFPVVTAGHHLRKRSPDSMEVQMPGYSSEDNGDKMKNEGEYWQGEGDKMNERREDAREDR